MSRPRSNPGLMTAFAGVWLIAVCTGSLGLVAYSHSAGETSDPPSRLPALTSPPRENTWSMLMFIHPRCPCTRASVRELTTLMQECSEHIAGTVYLYQPTTEQDWSGTQLWKSVQTIPGVQTVCDSDAMFAQRFDAPTSGQIFLYDSQGQLVFNGGITPARGQTGACAGQTAIREIISGQLTGPVTTPVFGCNIYDTTLTRQQGEDEICTR